MLYCMQNGCLLFNAKEFSLGELKVLRFIPEFRILRRALHRKSASKYYIELDNIITASLNYFQFIDRQLSNHFNFCLF